MAAGDILKFLRGTMSDLFQLGKTGPNLKKNGTAIEARNNADSAYTIVRGATPVGNDDLTTKLYVDGISAATAVKEIQFTIGTSTASSTATIPANAQVIVAELKITTAYSGGTSPAITIGQIGNVTLYQTSAQNDIAVLGQYMTDQDTDVGGSALAVLATVTGSPTAGAATVTVRYVEPAA